MIKRNEKDIYIQYLGGASEVGATSIFLYWKGERILIDSGARQVKDKYPIFEEINDDIDLFILTHLHGDHVGSLMECENKLNLKRMITSPDNKSMLKIALEDSQKILKSDFEKEKNEIKKQEIEKKLDIYSSENIDRVIRKMETKDFYKTIYLGKTNLKITFYKTSHLLGSLGILFEDGTYTLFLTCDFTESKKFFHQKTEFISKLKGKKIDTMITETTYGRNDESDEILKEKTLTDLSYGINKIFKNEGNVLIPCFALGRMQEVISAILRLILEGRISRDTKIYIHNSPNSLGIKYTEKYLEQSLDILAEELTINGKNYFEILNKKQSQIQNNQRNNFNLLKSLQKKLNIARYNPKEIASEFRKVEKAIFLIQPGMLGPVNEELFGGAGLALEIISGDRDGIIFVGYQAPNTIGGKIQNTNYLETITIGDRIYKNNNRNIYKVTFPGHVSVRGVIDLIKELNPENIMLVHGDLEASRSVEKGIKDKKVFIPEIDEKVYLIDNGEKKFFSMQHKFSKIVIDINQDYRLNPENTNILESEEYDEYPVVKLIKSKNIGKIQKKLLHFEFIISRENEKFFERLMLELREIGISSNISYYNNQNEEIMEDIAMLISDTNEKSSVYLVSVPFELVEKVIVISQMTGTHIYIYNNNFELILNFPFDISENIEKNLRKELRTPEVKALIRKLRYYHQLKSNERKRIYEEKLSERPNYDISNGIYKSNIFYCLDNSLWGDIDHIYGIKSKEVVEDLEFIYSKLNEKIKSIRMLNYIFSYKENKIYREILGISDNKIFGKYYLENGIQYFEIVLKRKEKIDRIVEEIKKYKEL
jgi:endoribonuclease YSH1